MTDASRREFIKRGAGVVAGAAVAGGMSLVATRQARAAVTYPFGYTPLDVEVVRQAAYDGYKGITIEGVKHAHCAFGSFHGILGQLALADPDGPYVDFPTPMMAWASSGVQGFATFCGALNGACAAIGLICAPGDQKGFIQDLLTWYTQAMLPTNIIAPTGVLAQSQARTTLCHNSVTNWCRASGYASGSPERSERCARLTGDVAAKAVEMLNNGRLGLPMPAAGTVCRSCHYAGTDYGAGQFTRGEEDCVYCHTEISKVSAKGHKGGQGP